MSVDANWGVNRNGYLEIVWNFNPESLEFIEGIGESQTFPSGSVLFSEGEPAEGMYLILEGTARVIKKLPEGERTVALLDPIRSVGEVAMLTHSRRMASVVAESDLRVLKITRENLMRLSVDNPHFALQIYRILAESLARAVKETGVIPLDLQKDS